MEIPYNLIIRYLADECSSDEVIVLADWRQSSTENETIFTKIADSYNQKLAIPDKEKIWEKIAENISIDDIDNNSHPIKIIRFKKYLLSGVAACLLALLATSVYFFTQPNVAASYTLVETEKGHRSFIQLPDGSKVWLNHATKLKYSDAFNQKDRDVSVSGEAFFDVKKNIKLPFNVFADKVNIKVTGTMFNISAHPNNETISVSLIEGAVNVLSAQDQQLLAVLKPNQKIDINKNDLKYTISEIDQTHEKVWINGKLSIDGLSANNMFDKIGDRYSVSIRLINVPKQTRYWITLKDESLIETLQVINKITPINYSIDRKEVTIQYK